ncbi:MAG: hypothetical protein GTN64_02435 [Candidatus Latescibacteria bacterium]|nr:hypothetical protein [Candidatus Latescibacterota bacterium]NIO77475.1 hypothetical protein [Candidatus Latescibacterota bacterium]
MADDPKDEAVTAAEIIDQNTKLIDTDLGKWLIRKLSGFDFYNYLGFLPSGDKIDLPTEPMQEGELNERLGKLMAENPEKVIRCMLTYGPVRPQLSLDGIDDKKKNIVSISTAGEKVVLQLLNGIKEFTGMAVPLGAGPLEGFREKTEPESSDSD